MLKVLRDFQTGTSATLASRDIVSTIIALTGISGLHFGDYLAFNVNQNEYALMGEYLPKSLLEISSDGKTQRLNLMRCGSLSNSERGSMLSAAKIIEMYARSKAEGDRKLERLAVETVRSMQNEISFPYPVTNMMSLSSSNRAIKDFEIILQRLVSGRRVVVKGILPGNERVSVTFL